MCGRYALFSRVETVAAMFGVVHVRLAGYRPVPRFNIAPGQAIAVVRPDRAGERELGAVSWGFVPRWRSGQAAGRALINARRESVAVSPMFREAAALRRCIVPADLFYEWSSVSPQTGRRRPFAIRPAGGGLLALAGIWESHPPGRDAGAGETPAPQTAAILTRPSTGEVAPIHDRMPVILPRRCWDAWMDPATRDARQAAAILADAEPPPLEVRAVSTWVNDPGHDDPACIAPESDGGALFAD